MAALAGKRLDLTQPRRWIRAETGRYGFKGGQLGTRQDRVELTSISR
jgi:hypothetical protein